MQEKTVRNFNDNGEATNQADETPAKASVNRLQLKDEVDTLGLDAVRRNQDFSSATAVRKQTSCKVRKPAKEWWIMVHPDPDFSVQAGILALKEENEWYWVHPSIWSEVASEPTFTPMYLTAYATTRGGNFIWPIRLPDEDGKLDDWNQSALEAAQDTGRWQRIAANKHMGCYEVWHTDANWKEPNWPDSNFEDLLRVAFKGRIITDTNHDVLKQLSGEQCRG